MAVAPPYEDPRVSDLVARQAEDRRSFNESLESVRADVRGMRSEMTEGFKAVGEKLDAKKWTPGVQAAVAGPALVAIIYAFVQLKTGSTPGP